MQLNYNYMLKGVYQLLEVRKLEIEATHDYVRALQDYWTAYADLERAVGGKLPENTSSTMEASGSMPQNSQQPPKSESHAHHHGSHS